MAVLSWGKPKIAIRKINGDGTYGDFILLNTPVEGTTELTTTKGDKTEAKIEGGENEAVRYARNTYALAATIRGAKNRKKPVGDSDGVIDGEYQVFLQPEDETAPGMVMQRSTLSVEETFTAADGLQWAYTADALKPESGEDQVQWGTVTFNETSGAVTAVKFTEYGEGTANDATEKTFGGEKAQS
jgi:hypothetical protein